MIRDRSIEYTCEGYQSFIATTGFLRFIKQGAIAVVAALVVKEIALESFYIPSSSMTPTLRVDDCIIVPKLAYGLHVPFSHETILSWSSPPRGEVVVFNREDDPMTGVNESLRTMVKRVIGLPGDRIVIRGAEVYVNDKRMAEPYARWKHGGVADERIFTVPEGALFMLGDNRDESYDSRFWTQPFVPTGRVVGPVAAVYWSQNSARG